MIILKQITKSFGEPKIIDGLSAEFQLNQVTSVVAPNGTGKTTLMSIISGLLLPDSGEITFLAPLKQADVVIVLAGEKNLYYKNTVEENLIYFGVIRGLTPKNIKKQISYYQDFFPVYGKIQGRRVEELSYGQKRLVSLFSAIISEAKCIIVDEVSEGLDMEYVGLVKNLLQTIKNDRIIIITSHDYAFVAETADTNLFLKDGKIVKVLSNISKDTLMQEYIHLFGEKSGGEI